MPANTVNPIVSLLNARNSSRLKGIYSCCSANEYVIRAALRRGKAHNIPVLIEATANQVNQNGGYTGMTPQDFIAFLSKCAAEESFPPDKLLCGGDHLGPLTWQALPETEAMANAQELIRAYVAAGFTKIHIDTSMRTASDDAQHPLTDAVIARRGAVLCTVAERSFAEYQKAHPRAPAPVYVIGSEVPIPGGAQENEDSVTLTSPAACEATLSAFRSAFDAEGLHEAWRRVIAIVVQPGVEFGDESVIEYNHAAASKLTQWLGAHTDICFEGHSTDYQPRSCLKEMVDDGIAILKVGPALTFALREGLFALEQIETEQRALHGFVPSDFRCVLEQAMQDDRAAWEKYYHGNPAHKRYSRAYSLSDRARYYLDTPEVNSAINALLDNLRLCGIPTPLLRQYLPMQYARVQAGKVEPCADALLIDHVGDCIDDYLYAILGEI